MPENLNVSKSSLGKSVYACHIKNLFMKIRFGRKCKGQVPNRIMCKLLVMQHVYSCSLLINYNELAAMYPNYRYSLPSVSTHPLFFRKLFRFMWFSSLLGLYGNFFYRHLMTSST